MNIIAFITSFFEHTHMSIFEAIMLICWGLSWPVSITKALRTKIVHGKSPLFMSLIAAGYLCGILNKILYSRDYLILLYVFNLSMILTDLYLFTKYHLKLTRKDSEIVSKTSPEHKRERIDLWKKDALLNDGTTIHIRLIRKEDESALRRFFEKLSQESVYFRFGQLRLNMLHDYFTQLCQANCDQDLAFVAVVYADTGEDMIIGEVRLNMLADLKSAELSFIVDDEWQRKGVGNLLMSFCLKLAKEVGLEILLMLVMKNNLRMKRFGYKYDFRIVPGKKENDMEEWQLKLKQAVDTSLPPDIFQLPTY